MTPVDRLQWIAAVTETDMRSSAVRVAVVLAKMANGDGQAWPSIPTLAKAANLSDRSAQMAIDELVEGDFLDVDRNAKGDRSDRRVNIFTIRNGVNATSPREPERGEACFTTGVKKPADPLHVPLTGHLTGDKDEPTDENAKRILAEYADRVKPPRLDTSRGRAKRHLEKHLRKHSVDDLLASVANYAADMDAAGTEAKYRRNAGNFFGQDRDFEQYLPDVYEPPLSEQDREHAAFVKANLDEIMQMEADIDDGEDDA